MRMAMLTCPHCGRHVPLNGDADHRTFLLPCDADPEYNRVHIECTHATRRDEPREEQVS